MRAGVLAMLGCTLAGIAHPQDNLPQPQSASPASLSTQETELRQELAAHPDSAASLYRLGALLRQENKPHESIDTYTQAARLQKPDAQQVRSVALDYVLLNDYDQAIHWLQIAFSMDPSDADIAYSLGRCFYTQQRFTEAEAMYRLVLKRRPDDLKAQENLGLTYAAENQPDKAEQVLREAARAADQQETDEWPYFDYGDFLLEHGRAADALPPLRRAAALAPACAACHEQLGRALLGSGDLQGAVQELQVAMHLSPADPKMHYELARAYRAAGEMDKSKAESALSRSLYKDHSHED
jgi:tetratricopeptide (TPR) repeat protein